MKTKNCHIICQFVLLLLVAPSWGRPWLVWGADIPGWRYTENHAAGTGVAEMWEVLGPAEGQ